MNSSRNAEVLGFQDMNGDGYSDFTARITQVSPNDPSPGTLDDGNPMQIAYNQSFGVNLLSTVTTSFGARHHVYYKRGKNTTRHQSPGYNLYLVTTEDPFLEQAQEVKMEGDKNAADTTVGQDYRAYSFGRYDTSDPQGPNIYEPKPLPAVV